MSAHPTPDVQAVLESQSPHNELVGILRDAQSLQVRIERASRGAKARMNHMAPHAPSWRRMAIELGRFSDALADYVEKSL